MNKGFTKLEILLVIIIFLCVATFLGSKALSLFGNNKYFLEQRFNKLYVLSNEKKFDEVYNFYDKNIKQVMSKEKYLSQKSQSNIVKVIPKINSITIKNDTAYIDRTLIICLDDNCLNKNENRGYSKWVYQDGNWFLTTDMESCIREQPYDKSPEFDRALSLLKQRMIAKWGANGFPPILNCLDIQYSNINDAEGYFTFDKNNSSLDRFQIFVDNSYKIKDDILTAFLLSHEIQHASDYVAQVEGGTQISCYDLEIRAFLTQVYFLGSLNIEEMRSLASRVTTFDNSNNSPLLLIETLGNYAGNASNACGQNNSDCYSKKLTEQITSMVKSNPYYQKECGN